MSRKICFFEPDEGLAEKLIDYWNSHGMYSYRIYYYSDAQKWKHDREDIQADLWILDCSLKPCIERPLSGKVLWWSEHIEDTEAVFKYRSADVLMHTILGYFGEESREQFNTRLISLYSPVRRSAQTVFGITLAHLLSKKGRTLYLNLEGYSGFDHTLSGSFSKDISDFIYYVNQSSENISLILQKYIYRLGEVDIIPPVCNPCNLQEITEPTWLHIIGALQASMRYEYIVIDVSDFIQGAFSILKASQYVFSLTKTDARAAAKWQQYTSILTEMGCEEILERTHKFQMPQLVSFPTGLEDCMLQPLTEIVAAAAKQAGVL